MPRTLVIGPGGVKGYLALGFLCPLEDRNFLEKVDTFAGVSVGAIISLLLVVGYKVREIIGISEKLELFKDVSNFSFPYIMENQGLLSNQPIRQVLINYVMKKMGNVPTLHELYLKKGKSLITVALNATDEKEEIITPFNSKDILCVDAVMYSMNIPFFFYKLMCNNKIYVDGALANPYPVDFFDDGIHNVLGIFMCNTDKDEKKIIRKIVDKPIGFIEYSSKILNSLLLQRRNSVLSRTSKMCRHVLLSYKNHDIISVVCGDKEKVEMLVEGYNKGREFLDCKGEDFPVFSEKKYEYPFYEI